MAYSGRKRPPEKASKIAHSKIINNDLIQNCLNQCDFLEKREKIALEDYNIINLTEIKDSPIKKIFSIDGSYTNIFINEDFPSSQLVFFQYAADYIEMSTIEELKDMRFISPEFMSSIDKNDCHSFVIPTKNISRLGFNSLKDSIRSFIFDHFCNEKLGNNTLIETLEWFIFELYNSQKSSEFYELGSCPNCFEKNILSHDEMEKYTFKCKHCSEKIYLTDVFRLNELMEGNDSNGVITLLLSLLEQFLLIHYFKFILENSPFNFKETLFIKDGPLAFFGQTANMYKLMKKLIEFIAREHDLFLVGIEKSGPFETFAHEFSDKMPSNSLLLLNHEFIYKYIRFGEIPSNYYGSNTLYGDKVIFKSSKNKIYVLSVPVFVENNVLDPKIENFINMDIISSTLDNLQSDRYDNAFVPIVMVNKKVSLSNMPSNSILQKFARKKFN